MESTGMRVVGGRYRLIDHLGQGGMGTVWRAEDAVLGRHVAVKEVVFPHGLSAEERETLRERTRREARAAARLDHPSAVTVYDVVEEDGQPWLVLELVEADTLAQVVKRDGPLSPQRAAEVGLAVLGALEAAHARGIVHRDVKPSNVLLGTSGRTVLTDFGIATSTGDSSITSTGLLLGSPSYISPERARGQAPGPASDLWALGATLFTAVEGRAPYDKGEPLPTMTAVVTGDREPYRSSGPLVPVLDGLLEADPERRLDARSARRLLEEVARSGATAPGPVPAGDVDTGERTAALVLPPAAPPAPAPSAAPQRFAAEPPAAEPAPAAATTPAPPRRRVPTRLPEDEPARAPRRTGTLLAGAALGLAALLGGGYALTTLDDGSGSAPSGTTAPVASPDAGEDDGAGGEGTGEGEGTGAEGGTGGDGGGEGGGEGGDSAVAAPEGFTEQPGPGGSVVVVPETYTAITERSGSELQYRDPDTRRTLRVQVLPGGGKEDAVGDRRAAAADFSTRYPEYEEIGITPVDYRGDSGADWEFLYTDGGAELHVLNRVFSIDGTGHSLWFQTPAGEWDAAQEDLEQVLASFRPAGS